MRRSFAIIAAALEQRKLRFRGVSVHPPPNTILILTKCAGCGVMQEVAGPYAAVIIAAPLEQSKLRFKGVQVHPPPARQYQEVVATYVTGALRASYFGVQTLPTGETHSQSSLIAKIL